MQPAVESKSKLSWLFKLSSLNDYCCNVSGELSDRCSCRFKKDCLSEIAKLKVFFGIN